MNRRPSISFAVKAALVVCAVGVAFHGATKSGGGRLVDAPVAKQSGRPSAKREPCEARSQEAAKPPYGDEASSLVAATVGDGDIARGWRLESVETNGAAFCEMPTNAVVYEPWTLRGGRETWFPLDFGDFAFPLGTDAVRRVRVKSGGEISAFLPNTPNAIRAAAEWASLIPGVSRFWSADADGGAAKVLTWERVFANRDRTGEYSAQITLRRNGDFTTQSNDVRRVYRRVNPYDWDGDGLANWIDPHPTESDGDCFGTGVDWLNANCGGVLSATTNAQCEAVITWNDGANPDAYYWLTFTSLSDNNRITATCDGESNLGDLEIIANEGQVCRIPLLIGAEYTIESTDGIANITASDGRVEIFNRADGRVDVLFQLDVDFDPSYGDEEDGWYSLLLTPADVGAEIASVTGGCNCVTNTDSALAFNCVDDCGCKGADQTLKISLRWEGYHREFSRTFPCPCDEPLESDSGFPRIWLSVPNVMYTKGDGSATVSDLAPLSFGLESEAPTNGTIRLMSASGADTRIWTNTNKTTQVFLPFDMSAAEFASTNFYVEGVSVSPAKNYGRFEAMWFDGEGNPKLSVHKYYTIYCPVVDVVNNNMTTLDGTLYNPSGIEVGTNAYFAVSFLGLEPPDEDIRWSVVEGPARFVGGDTGRCVAVTSDERDRNVRLRVQIGDCVSPPIEFLACTVDHYQVKVTVCIVQDTSKGYMARTADEVRELFKDVDRIYRQIGVSFRIDRVLFLDNKNLLDISEDEGRKCSVTKHLQLVNTLQGTSGLEVYFVDFIAKDVLAHNDKARGIVASAKATANTIAHEIGHSFGCADVYHVTRDDQKTPLPDSSVCRAHLPQDWSNGDECRYYHYKTTQGELIRRMLMCGFGVPQKQDMTYGSVYGYGAKGGGAGLIDTGFFTAGERRYLILH